MRTLLEGKTSEFLCNPGQRPLTFFPKPRFQNVLNASTRLRDSFRCRLYKQTIDTSTIICKKKDSEIAYYNFGHNCLRSEPSCLVSVGQRAREWRDLARDKHGKSRIKWSVRNSCFKSGM